MTVHKLKTYEDPILDRQIQALAAEVNRKPDTRNVDGGSPGSTYLPTQVINGGNP